MNDVESHLHGYRSPLSAIIGLAEAALTRSDLDSALVKQLRAIRALAQDALDHAEPGNSAHEDCD